MGKYKGNPVRFKDKSPKYRPDGEHREKLSREKSRTNILKGKGYNASPKKGFSGGARGIRTIDQTGQPSTGQPMARASLMNSDNVKVGMAMRGARKVLKMPARKR